MSGSRLRALTGRHALVDGIPFDLPVNSEDSPALMAGFLVDHDAVRALLPGEELVPVRLPKQRSLLLVTVIDYRTTDIGSYVEFSIAFAVRHRQRGTPWLATLLRERTTAVGQYVWDLPVSTDISVKGGKGIWGMPKHRANLDFRVSDAQMSSQYDLDGQLCMRITVDRPGGMKIPLRGLGAANYCQFRGLLMKSRISFSDDVEMAVGRWARAELLIGDHPRMAPLRSLDVEPQPSFVACLPHSHGVLDDYFESWFLTSPVPVAPADRPEGLESVVDLTNDQGRLDPPKAAGR